MNYMIIFFGTPYLDGTYSEKSGAIHSMEGLREMYPGIRIEVAQVDNFVRINDEFFWYENKDELEEINSRFVRSGKYKTTLPL
jgi:hypothetical protein|tara:strand:+ start:1017 stop:1265 length:249 start_codon:yes stop_codon:yes gene_type:complete